MYPLLSAELAAAHRTQLLREAESARLAPAAGLRRAGPHSLRWETTMKICNGRQP
jgi:hypothetical protein